MVDPSAPAPADWRARAAIAQRLADDARAHTLARFFAPMDAENKAGPGDFDPVTEADRQAEHAMRALLRETAPDDGVQGEEWPDTPASGPWSWTLDPVDGTRGFICGFPTWTTLIAASHEGRPVLGIIDQPVVDDRFIGDPQGARRVRAGASSPLHVRPCAHLTEAIVCATGPDMFTDAERAGFEQVSHAARLTRFGADAYAYAMLAAGRVDLVIEAGLKPYDVRALIPVVRGAGGLLTDWRGDSNAVHEGGQVIAAGDHRAHQEALVALRRVAA